jgi:hypothetical protein
VASATVAGALGGAIAAVSVTTVAGGVAAIAGNTGRTIHDSTLASRHTRMLRSPRIQALILAADCLHKQVHGLPVRVAADERRDWSAGTYPRPMETLRIAP